MAQGDWEGPTVVLAPAAQMLFSYAFGWRKFALPKAGPRAGSATKARKTRIVVVHGDRDSTVPLRHSEALLAAHKEPWHMCLHVESDTHPLRKAARTGLVSWVQEALGKQRHCASTDKHKSKNKSTSKDTAGNAAKDHTKTE